MYEMEQLSPQSRPLVTRNLFLIFPSCFESHIVTNKISFYFLKFPFRNTRCMIFHHCLLLENGAPGRAKRPDERIT